MTRLVRVREEKWLARPDLWKPEGLAECLRESGIDPGRPYRQDEPAEDGWLLRAGDLRPSPSPRDRHASPGELRREKDIEEMTTRFRYDRAAVGRDRATAEAAGFRSARDYWTGIVIGYLAAVLMSVGLMLALVKHGW